MRLNETIKQLAEEARISVPTGLEVSEWIERYNETFAKLIIQECANVAHTCIDDEWFDVGGAILDHFGVE
jgi:hypothetical protein